MRIVPPELMVMRRQRIGSSPAAVLQAPLFGLVMSIWVNAAGAVGGWISRPRPLNHTLLPPVAVTTAFGEPSALARFWMICGASVSEASCWHAPLASVRLTTQFLPVVDNAQAEVRLSTSWKRTVVLR